MAMTIYMVCDDWIGKMEFYDKFDVAKARRQERFDEFWTDRMHWHRGKASIEDFYIEEYTLNVKVN